MTPKSRPKVALLQVAFGDLKNLQGNLRRQMIVTIDGLDKDIRPSNSKQLIMEGEMREIRRLRLGKWRIIYAIVDEHPLVFGSTQASTL